MESYIILVYICVLLLSWKICEWIRLNIIDRTIPGPLGLPVFGSAFSVNPEKIHLTFYDWALKYGRIFRVQLPGNSVIVVNDFDLVRKLFADTDQVEYFNGRPETFVGKYAVFDTSDLILYPDNDARFTVMKKSLIQGIRYQAREKQFKERFEEEMERLFNVFDMSDGKDFEFNPVLRESLANLVSILMSGEAVNKAESNLLWGFNDCALYFLETSVNVFLSTFPTARFLPGKLAKTYKKMMSTREWIVHKYYDGCKLNIGRDDNAGLVYSLFQMQAEINKEKGAQFLSDDYIKGIIIDLITAAMKTSNTVVVACFLTLLNNPEHIAIIQKEIDDVIGTARLPQETDQSKMDYTRAFVYELLRCITPGSLGIPHQVSKEHIVDGFCFRKGEIVLSNIWFIHHDPNFWEEPWKINPKRFLDAEGHLLPPSHENMRRIATFSVGRRVCAGKDFSLTRIFLYLTSILQRFHPMPPLTEPLMTADPTYFMPGLLMEPKTFKCRLVRREVFD